MPGHTKMMTYQDYVKLRSKHMREHGTTLTGSERMKQIANEWNSKGKGIVMAGGSFMDIIKQLPGLIMGGQLKTKKEKGEGFSDFLDGMTDAIGKTSSFLGGEIKPKKQKMTGHGAKLNKLKKYALKIGLPLATAAALMTLGNRGGIDIQSGFDSRNFQPFVDVEMERNTPQMDEDEITGLGVKKKGNKKAKYPHHMAKGNSIVLVKNKKQHDALKKAGYKTSMEGEGFFDFIGDAVGSIQDGIKGAFGNPTNASDVITKTAGMTLSALPFIL